MGNFMKQLLKFFSEESKRERKIRRLAMGIPHCSGSYKDNIRDFVLELVKTPQDAIVTLEGIKEIYRTYDTIRPAYSSPDTFPSPGIRFYLDGTYSTDDRAKWDTQRLDDLVVTIMQHQATGLSFQDPILVLQKEWSFYESSETDVRTRSQEDIEKIGNRRLIGTESVEVINSQDISYVGSGGGPIDCGYNRIYDLYARVVPLQKSSAR